MGKSIYTFDDGKLYKKGVFLEEEGAWDNSNLDDIHIILFHKKLGVF